MKKSLFLAVLLIAFALPAAALSGGEYREDADEILYIGPNNYMYVLGENDAVLTERAREIVALIDGTVYYTIDDEASDEYTNSALLYAYDVDQSSDPREIARVSFDALYAPSDGLIYYTSKGSDDALMAFDPSDDAYISCARSDESIVSLSLSGEGLLVKTESGEKLYDASAHALADADDDMLNSEITSFDGGEIIINSKSEMYVTIEDGTGIALIDTDVISAVGCGGSVCYIKKTDASSSLMSYSTASETGVVLEDYDEVMINGLVSTRDKLYFIGKSGVVYEYSLTDSETRPFAFVDTAAVRQPYLVAVSNLLLIYDYSADKDNSFVRKINLDAYTPAEDDLEMLPDDGNTGEAQYAELSKGSRGDDVVKLQQALKSLGYLSGSADGVFGNATLDAVMLLQEDLGLKQTGVADDETLRKLYGGEASQYEPYAGLKPGDSGSRVTQLQDRLRALYYMVAPASGSFDEYTGDAVKRYQSQMGHKASGSITDVELEELYSKKAEKCEDYLPLQSGDNAPAVKRLATRLKKLGYLSQSATNSYNKYVIRAIKLFESNNGLRETGKASVKRQELIYSSRAKPYYPDPTPVPEKKYITEKQLKKMRTWMSKNLGGNFSKAKAIETLQIELMNLGFMGGSTTRKYDEATYNCVKEAQRAFGLKVTGVANADTLAAMFFSVG